ncbi:four helix bundle protein [Acidobacteria bacterium AB60]|nr:four helix bundle protein [Acidobacteria bacterium AB60]
MQSFRDLNVWQKAMELAAVVYRLTQRFPREEAFGLTSQLRRSAVSIPSNIAEGHGRMNPREFKYFLLIARGSNCELQTQLELSGVLGFVDPRLLETAQQTSHSVDKMLFALLGNLKNKST